jgi:ribosomal protein S12 methylthiotransferase
MAEGNILPYIDVPFQHASPEILKSMKRPANAENNLERISGWRKICPEIVIRSTFIVGFPGETEKQFENLIEFLEQAKLDRVGCFIYSNVEGAAANAIEGQVDADIKQDRLDRLMKVQKRISQKKLSEKVGSIQTVIVDGIGKDYASARSYASAPEIDGVIYLENPDGLEPGDMLDVKIKSSKEYDLYAGPK